MSTFHDELVRLTADQPAQPGDRVTAVTGRARRIRRRRSAAAGLAVVALGVLGAGVVQLSRPSPVHYTATPLTQWPDRSDPAAQDVGFGAFTSWYGPQDGSDPHLKWLYRGVIRQPDGSQKVVADFIATKDYVTYVVSSSIDRSDVDDNGLPQGDVTSWLVDQTDLATMRTAPSHLEHVISGDEATVVVSIEAPSARDLRWSSAPLPYAPPATGPTSGTIRSGNGVFVVHLSGLTGPATLTDPAGHDRQVEPVQLVTPERFPTTPPSPFTDAGAGTTSRLDNGTWGAAESATLDPVSGRRAVDIRCYGGGRMTATLRWFDQKDTSPGRLFGRGSVPCDGGTHRAFDQAAVSGPGYDLTVTGDRLQAYAFQMVRE